MPIVAVCKWKTIQIIEPANITLTLAGRNLNAKDIAADLELSRSLKQAIAIFIEEITFQPHKIWKKISISRIVNRSKDRCVFSVYTIVVNRSLVLGSNFTV